MEHHVTYLPPPGLPPSTEHDPNLAQPGSHSSITSTSHSEHSPVTGHGGHHPEQLLHDGGKQSSNHGHHSSSSGDVSHDRMHQPHVMQNASMHGNSSYCYGNHSQSGFAMYADKSNHASHHDTSQHRSSDSLRQAGMETENVHQASKVDQSSIYRPVDLPSYYSRFMPDLGKQSSDYRHHPKTADDGSASMRGHYDVAHVSQAGVGDHFHRGSINPFQPPDLSHGYRVVTDNTKHLTHPVHRESLPHESLRQHPSEQQHRYQSSSDDSPDPHPPDRSSPSQPQDLSRSRLHVNSSDSTNMASYPYTEIQGEPSEAHQETDADGGQRNSFHHTKHQSSGHLPPLHMPFYGHELYRKAVGSSEHGGHSVGNIASPGQKTTDNVREQMTASPTPLNARPTGEGGTSSPEETITVSGQQKFSDVRESEKEIASENDAVRSSPQDASLHLEKVNSPEAAGDVTNYNKDNHDQREENGEVTAADVKTAENEAEEYEAEDEENSSHDEVDDSEECENAPRLTEHSQMEENGQHQNDQTHGQDAAENTDGPKTTEMDDTHDVKNITVQHPVANNGNVVQEKEGAAAESVEVQAKYPAFIKQPPIDEAEDTKDVFQEKKDTGDRSQSSKATEPESTSGANAPENLAPEPERDAPIQMKVDVTVDSKWQQVMSESGFGDRHSDFAGFLLNFYISNKAQVEQLSINAKPSRSNSRKSRRPSRQSHTSPDQVFISDDIEEQNVQQSGATLASEGRPRLRPGRKAAQPKVASVNRRKGGQRMPRKRKLDESYLPYSPVPIYKTKPSDPLYNMDANEFRGKNQSSLDRVGVISFSEDSSLESGVDADDHASDADFQPAGYHSDSADDDKPLNFHKTKLRSHSSSGLNSSSVVNKKTECEYILENNNPRAPLKIKFKQSRKLSESQVKKDATQVTGGTTTRTRKPRKPAKPKKTVRAKRPAKPKARAEEGAAAVPAKRGRKPSRNTTAPVKQRRSKNSKPIVKISWNELMKQYQCKICQYESPCITDMSLHLFDGHMEVVDDLAKVYSKLEITVGDRTATAFEFLTGRKYEDKSFRGEDEQHNKRLPPVSGILSSILSHQEAESRMPPTSEIVMTALSQALPPATNAMAFLHGAPPGAVFGALSATGALPYIPGLSHHALGDGGLPPLPGGGYPPNISRSHECPPMPPSSIDSHVSLLNAAAIATSQASSVSQTSSEADAGSPATDASNRQKPLEGISQQSTMLSCQSEPRGLYLNKFRKSGVDIEQLSKSLEVDQVITLIEKWVKIRTQCPNCHRGIRVSKRTNKHRCRGSDDKPVYVLCDVCGNSYQKEYFSLHYNRIHLQSLVSCNVCHKKFTPSSLPKHLFKHTNPPAAFKCGTCPKSFRFRMDLERHELVHRVDKPYMCPTCGRGFTQKSNMQYHMRQHTGEQPYKCDNCMKSFTHNVSLKNHLKKHHGIDLWAMGYTGGGRPKKEQNMPSSAPATTIPST